VSSNEYGSTDVAFVHGADERLQRIRVACLRCDNPRRGKDRIAMGSSIE
jgi:hypothetical protein